MSHTTEERYFVYPVFLHLDVIIDKNKGLNDIINYGLFHYARNIKYDYSNTEVAKQLVYNYYNKKLPAYLRNKLNLIDDVFKDNDYRGFNLEGVYEPLQEEIEPILKAFITDDEFFNKANEFYRISKSYYDNSVSGNMESCLKRANEIFEMIPPKTPMPHFKKSLLFEFRDNDKTEFEMMQLLCYQSIKSIIGKNEYAFTNKKHILARMFGFKSTKEIDLNILSKNNKVLFAKFEKRHHIDKLINEMQLSWEIITWSNYNRGIYVSQKSKKSHEALAKISEYNKKKNKLKRLNLEKQRIIESLNLYK